MDLHSSGMTMSVGSGSQIISPSSVTTEIRKREKYV